MHAISAEAGESCRALHVYLGPLGSRPRSLFHPESGIEEPFDFDTYLYYVRAA